MSLVWGLGTERVSHETLKNAIEEVSQVNAEVELGSSKKDTPVGNIAEGPGPGSVLTNCLWLTPNITHGASIHGRSAHGDAV